MRKWYSKTGGGPGDPENYCNFELRDPENFSRYDRQNGGYLTWIFILDNQNGEVLCGL